MLAEVSEAAVTLLEHLSKVEANAEIVVQGRAIPAMVDSMKEHRTVVAVLLPALRYGTLYVCGPRKSNLVIPFQDYLQRVGYNLHSSDFGQARLRSGGFECRQRSRERSQCSRP